MKEIKKLIFVLVAAIFFVGMFKICDKYAAEVRKEYASQIRPHMLGGNSNSNEKVEVADLSIEQLVQKMVDDQYSAEIVLAASGDILCQREQLRRAYNEDTGEFSFANDLIYVKDLFSKSNYAVGTLKTTLAGKYNGEGDEYYGYTTQDSYYNSPEILASDLKNAGFSLLNTATNHALDSGVNGLFTTIDNLDAVGLAHVGTAKTSESEWTKSVNIDGVQTGFIGCTNLTNGQLLPADQVFALNTLDNYNIEKVQKLCDQITQLKAANDLVVAMINFGDADSIVIEDAQRELADKVLAAGADIILGTGSRGLKPLEIKTVEDVSGVRHNGLVLYGMGALYSSEYDTGDGKDVDISAIFNIGITKRGVSGVYISSLQVIPVYLNWYDGKIQPVPVCEAKDTSKYAQELDASDMERINSSYEQTINHLLDGSNLSYEYSDYSYKINLQ